jgi:hypothetical protein
LALAIQARTGETIVATKAAEAPLTKIKATLAPTSGAVPMEAVLASTSALERPNATTIIAHASTSTPNSSSNVLNQDTVEFSITNDQEVGGNYYYYCYYYRSGNPPETFPRKSPKKFPKNFRYTGGCFSQQPPSLSSNFPHLASFRMTLPFQAADQDLDSTVDSNPMDEEVFRRRRSEEIMEGRPEVTLEQRPRYPLPANHPHPDPTEVDYRMVLVNLVSHARLLAEMNWDWRSDVASIDREQALENLATLYNGLIAKYDHLVLAYSVLVRMYDGPAEDDTDATDAINATGPNDGPIQNAQEDQDKEANACQPPPIPPQANPVAPPTGTPPTVGNVAWNTEPEAGPSRSKINIPHGYTRHNSGLYTRGGATPKIPRGSIPRGWTRCESGNVVKIGELKSPTKSPAKSPGICRTWRCKNGQAKRTLTSLTSYSIPQPSVSFSDITSIPATLLSESNWLSDLMDEHDIMTETNKVDESESEKTNVIGDTDDNSEDKDYAPDPTETGSRSTKSDTSMTSQASDSSSLKTFLAGNTYINLYSHPSETGPEARLRVDNWMEAAKNSKTGGITPTAPISSGATNVAHDTPKADNSGSFIETPPAPAYPLAPAQPTATAPNTPGPAQTRRSRLRPSVRPVNTRPRSYLLARDNTTFRQYLPEVDTIVEMVDLTKTESDSDNNNSSKKSTK